MVHPPSLEKPVKLYYSPGACSMASRIVFEEAGIAYEAVRVNLKEKRTADGKDFNAINPKGYVPTLQLGDGEVLTENSALLPYLGELNVASNLMPPAGSFENYRVREWLSFISGELHKNCSPLFRSSTPEATAQLCRDNLTKRLTYTNEKLGAGPFLLGDQITVADAYLYVVLTWLPKIKVDTSAWPHLNAYYQRMTQRPSVQKVLRDEAPAKAA